MPFQVGDLKFYKDDDPVYESRTEAEYRAVELSQADATIGVWTSRDEGSDLVSIAHEGKLFREW